MTSGPGAQALACVVLAHTDPVHVRRLVEALDPFPVFLHCDRRTSPAVFEQMCRGLPRRVRVLDRQVTGWATWGTVAAELAGYRAALAETDSEHIALLTGSDYPLAGSTEIQAFLADHVGRSFVHWHRLPKPDWGRSGGLARLRYRHRALGKRMLRVPVPRRLPRDVVLAGGSQLKVLARPHARRLLEAVDTRPDLAAFWRSSWTPDETFVHSVLGTPSLVPGWADESVNALLWYIGWDDRRRKSPPYLSTRDLAALLAARRASEDGPPKVFARKFATDVDTHVLDRVDALLRSPTTLP